MCGSAPGSWVKSAWPLETECARLVALGAVRVRLLPTDGDDESCLVMQDIEGDELCLD
jgi:hypothetical protein